MLLILPGYLNWNVYVQLCSWACQWDPVLFEVEDMPRIWIRYYFWLREQYCRPHWVKTHWTETSVYLTSWYNWWTKINKHSYENQDSQTRIRFGPGFPCPLQISHIFSKPRARASTTIDASVACLTSMQYMQRATLCIHSPCNLVLGRSCFARLFVKVCNLGMDHFDWSIPS